MPICFLQQQEDYLIAILKNKKESYQTVLLDSSGHECLRISGINRVSIENNLVLYCDGKHLYQD